MKRYPFNSVTRKNVHIEIAERALGRALKAPECVHHVDNDRQNNSNNNLVICPDQAYHMLLHSRQEALGACGHAEYRKCTYCRIWSSPDTLVKHVKWRRKGKEYPVWMHRQCNRDYQKRLLARKSNGP